MRSSIFTALLGLSVCALLMFGHTQANANTENFYYDSWETSVELSVDADGRAVAHIQETLVAVFPDHDQNKGIVRGLPKRFQGADAKPRNISVTDETGAPYPFFTEQDDTFLAIMTGTDDFVHGEQTYVISYDIPDPIFQPDDASVDEFYWDMVSVDRQQPINSFSASVTLDATLSNAFTQHAVAYIGPVGSSQQAEMRVTDQHASIAPVPLEPNEVVTIALGFERGVVTQPKQRVPNFMYDGLPAILSGLGFVTSATTIVSFVTLRRRHLRTGKAIIAQYDVPEHLPPLIAAAVRHPEVLNPIPAQILHLAVNGRIRIEERLKKDGSLFKKPRPILRKVDTDAATSRANDALDNRSMQALFTSKSPDVLEIPKSSSSFTQRMSKLTQHGKKQARKRGYFQRVRSGASMVIASIASVILLVAIGLVVAAYLTGFAKDLTNVAIVGVGVSLPFIVMAFMKHRVHTRKGAEAYEYLEGVKLFIKVAEAERIRILQSPSGAERRSVDGAEVLHLYERLLPYAVLFRLEKEWSTVLQAQYETNQMVSPVWYPALSARGIANLGDTVSAFSGVVTSAASYSSSSSGGSGGGGFAGGGGGGGFSGGR